jgi:hypothetical protein
MIDTIIAVALNLMNPQHLRNWESSLLLLYLITAKNAVISDLAGAGSPMF